MDKLLDIEKTSAADVTTILSKFKNTLKEKSSTHLGYPYNLSDRLPLFINSFLEFSINNLGDPFIESNYGVHSRPFELAVLEWFADLWKLNKEDHWGYVTGSGTEGNYQGIMLARENYPEAVLYASEDSHYSVFKAARMFRMKCIKVKSNENGSINIDHFKTLIEANQDESVIINANIGTTMKAAIDNIDDIIDVLNANAKKFYIHCDAALSGIITSMCSFEKAIGSISVSGHKFLGCPIPCGIILTRKHYIDALSQNIDYINSRDATIMGSRNGHAPLFLWYLIVSLGKEGIELNVIKCIEAANYLEKRLKDIGIRKIGRNDSSTTVTFEKPEDAIVKKWQLACSGDIAHIVVMPNVTKEVINEFIIDITS